MPGPISRIEGMRECREALETLSRTVQRNVGKRSLRAAGEVWVARQKATLPVSDRPSDPTPGSLQQAPQVVSSRTEKGGPRVALLIDDVAAVPGEFGTSKMQPHLKIRATTDAARDAMAGALAEALKIETDAAVRQAARKAKA